MILTVITRCHKFILLALCCLLSSFSIASFAAGNQFDQGLTALTSKKFTDIEQGVELIANSGDERAQQVLTLLLDGELYRHKKRDVLVVVVGEEDRKLIVRDLFADQTQPTETLGKRKVKRVPVNNKIRSLIKTSLATIQLSAQDEDARLAAVQALLADVDDDLFQLLQQKSATESSTKVLEMMNTAIGIYQLANSADETEQLAAIKLLGESLQPDARNALTAFAATTANNKLKGAAQKALGKIKQRANMADFAETLFFGLSLGSVLVLAAIGLAITFGVMGVINMAHGELIMLGAYTTYVVQTLMPNFIGASILVSIPLAFMVSAFVGILIERFVMRYLYGRPLETLLATFGISLILQQTVRSIFSPLNRSVATPEWMSGAIEINPILSLTLNRLYIILFCLIVFAMLYLIMRYTRLGIEMRAVSQNRAMARAMGIRSRAVDSMTFGLGSGIAGVAGVALSQLTNVGPNLGQAYIIDSFMVVVFGGVGNLWGTLVAGLSLGVANKVMEPWAGAVLAKILVLVFIILFIQKRPRGLFPQKGRSAEG